MAIKARHINVKENYIKRIGIAALSASTPVLSDIFAAKPFADLDAKWTINEQAAANFMRVIFPA